MKAILVIDIPDDYQEYGSGDWYVMGDDLSIVYEEDGALMNYKYIDDDMAQLKPMPQKLEYKGIEDDNIEISKAIAKSSWYRFAKPNEAIEFRSFAEGYNNCVDEILGIKNETSRTEI